MALSEKQWEIVDFPGRTYDCLICDGAVRSGKTTVMMMSFIDWAMYRFSGRRFGICGKTVDSAVKNIIMPYLAQKQHHATMQYEVKWKRGEKTLKVTKCKKENYFEIFGGKDESSFALIQGRTLAGIFLDEVTLMPRSFVEQAITRCSVDGAKLWFNCNPTSPQHWFYKEWIQKADERHAMHLHFQMEDNPGLSAKTIADYKSRFSGVFYERYILGRWVMAEGLIYPMYANTVKTEPRLYDKFYISMDYGILNPTAMILWGRSEGIWYAVREYYHSGRETQEQKTDAEYYEELEKLADGLPITRVIIDPSAASFITLVEQKHRFKVMDADNSVIEGIQHVAQCLSDRSILINDCCKRTIEEFGLYRWDEKATEDKPIKEYDHAMDSIRYFVQTVGIWRKKDSSRMILW